MAYTRGVDVAFPTGQPIEGPQPLSRFLPPVEAGMVRRALEGLSLAPGLLLEPFGSTPWPALEAARSGWAVVVAVVNPVLRFLLRHTAQPFALEDLQAALAHLAAAPKDGGRLEPYLLDLYRTACSSCGAGVSAEAFVWDRDAGRPVRRLYACPHCQHVADEPTTEEDVEQALGFERRGLPEALALERVAPHGDPDRRHAEAALAVYTGRARYALVTLVNKLEQLSLPAPLQAAAHALLLSAMEEASGLWGYPAGRARPRQLVRPPLFREANVWRAMEAAVGLWAGEREGVPVEEGEGPPPAPGELRLVPVPAREWLAVASARPDLLLAAVPRPNQALWTLSALWAGWLWGRPAAEPVKVALRRRRYDWPWHAAALHTALAPVNRALSPGTPVATFLAEAAPGFVEAALLGLERAGFRLEGRAYRADTRQAYFLWRATGGPAPSGPAEDLGPVMTEAVQETLRARAEPCPHGVLHAAAWSRLAAERRLTPWWARERAHVLTVLGEAWEQALAQATRRLDERADLERGLFWLEAAADGEPLADRVERAVVERLRREGEVEETGLEAAICRAFPGLLTPDRRLLRACLESYARPVEAEGRWALRPEDTAESRRADLTELRERLEDLGHRLGLGTEVLEEGLLLWREGRQAVRLFRLQESALLGPLLAYEGEAPLSLVLPGGRSPLLLVKAALDPRWRQYLDRPGGVLKFRHLRRLAEDPDLDREALETRLGIDPVEYDDPQLPLL